MKRKLKNVIMITTKPGVPLVIKTDASNIAISANLNQNGRPVTNFFRLNVDYRELKFCSKKRSLWHSQGLEKVASFPNWQSSG